MASSIACSLCGTPAKFFSRWRERNYYVCPCCKAVLMDPAHYLSPKEEMARYRQHKNDVEDAGYQQFVRPLVEVVQTNHPPESSGLDYGCGTGPVAAKLLREARYGITTYDPFFDKNEAALHGQYNFIICSEVAEHFHHPGREFKRLKSLLKPGGYLYCMTLRYSSDIDFDNWYYKNDPTHVIFYRQETAWWICEAFGFAELRLKERLIILQA